MVEKNQDFLVAVELLELNEANARKKFAEFLFAFDFGDVFQDLFVFVLRVFVFDVDNRAVIVVKNHAVDLAGLVVFVFFVLGVWLNQRENLFVDLQLRGIAESRRVENVELFEIEKQNSLFDVAERKKYFFVYLQVV
jgi:hypothetical protein